MAKAKKTKPRERMVEWRVSLIKGTLAKFIGYVHAPPCVLYSAMPHALMGLLGIVTSRFSVIPVRRRGGRVEY